MRIPNNEIWYTTTNSKVVANFDKYAFDSNLISNAYANNRGVLTFDDDITIIGESAFALCEELESITLPDTIVKIDIGAFSACQGLEEIYIPDSVIEIGECAFGLCVNLIKFSGKFATKDGLSLVVNGVLNQFALGQELQEYSIPSEVTEIGWSSFSDCQLAKVTLHNGIKKIGHSAFCGCQNLTDINIPNSITTIADVAFQDCINLKNIFIPKTVTNLGSEIFEGCNNILVKYEDESIKISKDKGLKQLLEEYVALQKDVPNGWIYSGDKTAKIIHVPYGVTLVKSEAFEGCENVEVIHFPQTIEEIEDGAFTDLDNLYRFESDYASSDGKCLIIKNTLVGFAPNGISKYQLPDGVVNIAPMVFRFNENLVSIDIPIGVRTIGYQAFFNCTNLIKVELPKSLNIIGESAFGDCCSIKKMVIPSSVKVIGESAFSGCEQLEEITLPDELVTINENIFTSCHSLKKINSQLSSKSGDCLIIGGTLIHYNGQSTMREYVIPNNVTTIAKNAFYSNSNIRKVVFPESVTTIGSGAFHSCKNLITAEFTSPTPPKFGCSSFYANARKFLIQVPEGAETKYRKALKSEGIDVLVVDKTKSNDVFHEIIYGNSYNNKISIENLLSLGIGCLHDRDKEGAIAVFEKVIERKYKLDEQPYDSLIKIYRDNNDIENEIRILNKAIETLPIRGSGRIHSEYQKRLIRLQSQNSQPILPKNPKRPNIQIKHGDMYEQELYKLPEFNFFKQKIPFKRWSKEEEKILLPINKIRGYFDNLLQTAENARLRKDYEAATEIYEQIVYENYWNTAPHDQLIKIYSKLGFHEDEIRILKYCIDHFYSLRCRQREYITKLAKKYDAEDFLLKERKNIGGRIAYYDVDIYLYNPYPIVEKWRERLDKKLDKLLNKLS